MKDNPRSQWILPSRLRAPSRRTLFALGISLLSISGLISMTGCRSKTNPPDSISPRATATLNWPEIGLEKVIYLRRQRSGDGTHPEFLSVTLLPGRGMNVFQITAWLPGKGEVPLLASPTIDKAALILNNGPGDEAGNQSFSMGGALLFPFANRIRGPLSPDKKTIAVTWQDRTVQLLANWNGKLFGAQPNAMHGQLLNARADVIDTKTMYDSASAIAVYHLKAKGHWFSDNDVTVDVTLEANSVDVMLNTVNTGKASELVGIGWHPYFLLPSGNRANARLHVPAEARVQVNNYDDVFPTGKLLPVLNTSYDFTADQGAPLPPGVRMDDGFVQLQRDIDDEAVCDLMDVGADYGLRVTALTPLIRAFQVFSPASATFVAIEPQFNYGDPLGAEWAGEDTGMITVEPDRDVTWKVRLELFQPSQETAIASND